MKIYEEHQKDREKLRRLW